MSHNALNFSPVDNTHATDKSLVDSLSENKGIGRHLFLLMVDHDNDFNNNKLTYLDNFTLKKSSLEEEVAEKNHVGDTLRKGTDLRFTQKLKKFLRVTVGSNVYNFRKTKQRTNYRYNI